MNTTTEGTEKFPSNIVEAVELLRKRREEHESMPHFTRAQGAEKQQFHSEHVKPLAAHVFAMQQGMPVIHHATAHDRTVGHATRPAQRAELLAKYRAVEPNSQVKCSVSGLMGELLQSSEPSFRYVLTTYRDALVKYAVSYFENFGFIYPRDRAEELRHLLRGEADPEKIAVLSGELALITGPGAEQICHNVRASVVALLNSVMEAARDVLIAAKTEAFLKKRDAEEAESWFFEGCGVPVESTAVSKRWDALRANLNAQLRPQAAMSMPYLPDPANVINTFGVQI